MSQTYVELVVAVASTGFDDKIFQILCSPTAQAIIKQGINFQTYKMSSSNDETVNCNISPP